jgi:glycosyltransferase involved in cell wall biosynthesis
MAKIKVLRIINRFNLGGPTFNAAYLSKYLDSEKFETLLVGGEKDGTEGSSLHITESLGLDPVIIPEMKREIDFKDDYTAYKKICKLIEEFQPDIVHTHASKAGTIGRLAARKMGVKNVYHTFHGHIFHSYFSKAKTTFFKHVEKRLAKSSTRIVAISDIQKKELGVDHSICDPEKITVIPLGFDLGKFQEDVDLKRGRFRREYKLEQEEVAVGIVGRLVPIKNHRLFLDALSINNQRFKGKVKYFIVGDGELREELESYCKTIGLAYSSPESKNENANLIFTSWIEDMDRVVAGVDIVALTSNNEGTPVSLIEAQAGNKPVVSTNVGGIENVILNGETGYLSPREDAHAFADNLLTLLEDKTLRENMSSKGWGNVGKRYHYTRLVNDVERMYLSDLN